MTGAKSAATADSPIRDIRIREFVAEKRSLNRIRFGISMHSANSALLSAARLHHARSGADATRAQLLLGAHPKQCMTARLRSKTWRGALNLVECIAYSAPLTKRLIRLSRASLSYVQLAPTQQPRRLQCLDGGSSHFRVMKDERIDSIVTSLQGKHRYVLDYTI